MTIWCDDYVELHRHIMLKSVEIRSELELIFDWWFLSHGGRLSVFHTFDFVARLRVWCKNESTNLLHGGSVPWLLHRTKRRLFVCVRVWTQQVLSVPVACVDCIFDVYTMIILLRLAWCSRVRTFSNVREFFRVCTLMVTRSHRCTHGRSRDPFDTFEHFCLKMSRKFYVCN